MFKTIKESSIKGLSTSTGYAALVGPFGELLVGEKTSDLSVSFKYPFKNTDFDITNESTTGDGTVTVSDSLLTCSSATTGTASIQSRDSVRYRTGHSGYIDFTGLFTGTGVGYIGGFDADDGFFIKYDNGSLTVGRRRAGVDTEVAQANFNGDADLNNLDLTKLNIFRIVFGYLGAANASFQVRQDGWKTLHVLKTENLLTTTTVRNPSFPVRVEVEDGCTISSGSWDGGTIGQGTGSPATREFTFDGSTTLNGTNLATMANFRNKSTYKTINNKVKVELFRYKFFVDTPATGTGTVKFKIIRGATIGGSPSYSDFDSDNSVIELDTAGTYTSGGLDMFIDLIGYSSSTGVSGSDSGGSAQLSTTGFGIALNPGETATITAQNVAGSTNVTVRAIFAWAELF